MIKTLTFGTYLYEIPLPSGYHLKDSFPLRIEEHYNGDWLVVCPAFDDYGYADSLDKALKDLGSSIIDLWKSLHKRKNLEPNLMIILSQLDEQIEEANVDLPR